MYTTDGTVPTIAASSTTKTYSSPFTVSSNCTVLYVYTDGTNINSAGSLNIGNIDKTAPTNTAPTATNTTNSITVTNKQTDAGGSGIKTRQYSIDGGSTWKTGTDNTFTFTGLTQNKAYTVATQVTDNAGNGTCLATLQTTVPEPPLPTTTNYTGYYADVNDDGTVDGVIFIDLAHGASGQWGDQGGYSYSATSNLRNYKISTKVSSYPGKFGTKQVIAPNGTSGNERFYVMALTNYDSYIQSRSYACSKTQTVGNVTFRLPSKKEWAAFGGQLEKTSYTSTYGLSGYYWASDAFDSRTPYAAYFSDGNTGYGIVPVGINYECFVRLCATF